MQLIPRKVSYETNLNRNMNIIIASSSEQSGKEASQRLKKALSMMDINAEIVDDPDSDLLSYAKAPVFVIGNLANSQCVKALYYKFLCVTDCWYPGPSGYEVRTLLDPLGTGYNIIHLGYSDDKGLHEGLNVLIDSLNNPLPSMNKVCATRLPISESEQKKIILTPLPKQDWEIANCWMDYQKGYLAYLTADDNLLQEYYQGWEAIIRCGSQTNQKIVQPHLFMFNRIITARLIEQTAMMSSEMRTKIIQYIYDWAQSGEGVEHINVPAYQSPYFPKHNHGLLPGYALNLAAEYFLTHYPDLKEALVWRNLALKIFAPYKNSWKTICDGLCHGWYLSQIALVEFGLLDKQHDYFNNSGARRAAECAMAVVNNLGWMPSAGDSNLLRSFPGPSLRVAAAYYKDGRYRFVHDKATLYQQFRSHLITRAFDTGLQPEEPVDQIGITVIEIDPLIYYVWEKEPELAKTFLDTPPDEPIDKCFDKIAVRSGWKEDDDYLLIDGLGTKLLSHSYADAMGILDYQRFGVSCIVSEDNYLMPEPESHSIVTITRDGEMGEIPSFAIIEDCNKYKNGDIYFRMKLKNYAGADWIREVHYIKNSCVVFHDTVIAKEPGSFAVEAHFRTPAHGLMIDGCFVSKRKSRLVGDVEFVLSGVNNKFICELKDIPINLIHRNLPGEPLPLSREDDVEDAFRRRYQTEEIKLTQYTARSVVKLNPGEKISFSHLAEIKSASVPRLHLFISDDGLVLKAKEWEKHLSVKYKYEEIKQNQEVNVKKPQIKNVNNTLMTNTIEVISSYDEGSLVCGCEDGTIALLSPNGKIAWERKVEGPIHDISIIMRKEKDLIISGNGLSQITAFDRNGSTIWSRSIQREPSPWPWWELNTPIAAEITVDEINGEIYIAVGCGDLQLRLYDENGIQKWMWRYNEGVPGRILFLDVDGDGINEIVVGGDISSDVSTCRVLTYDRKLKAVLPVEGWTSRLTAVKSKKIGNRNLLVCGANRGTNLHVYDLSLINTDHPYSLDADTRSKALYPKDKVKKLWEVALGGTVSSVHICEKECIVIAGTSQGFLLAYDIETGTKVWSKVFESNISNILPFDNKLVICEKGGQISILDAQGEEYATYNMGTKVDHYVLSSDVLWYSSANRAYYISLNNL